jgi:hypothetical protein
VELARHALLVHADRSERLRLGTVRLGGRERVMDFRIIDFDAGGLLLGAEREQIGFIGAGAVQAPRAVGQRLDKLHFDDAFGLQILEESLPETLICDEVMLVETTV